MGTLRKNDARVSLGDLVRVKRGRAREGHTFYVTATGLAVNGARLVWGGAYLREERDVELAVEGRVDIMGR